MKKTVFALLLGVWVFIAIGSVAYNVINTVSEIQQWYFLTNNQKKEKIFGDVYNFAVFVNNNTPSDTPILIVSKDLFPFYFARYYVYPKKVISIQHLKDISLHKTSKYIATYDTFLSTKDYILLKIFTNQSGRKGGLYIKK